MTSYYVIVSIKLYKEVGNDECIFVCNFGDRRMSGFEFIERGGGVSEGLPVAGSKKSPVSIGLKNSLKVARSCN